MIALDDNLENVPALRARLEILFLLAGSLHKHRQHLYSACQVAPLENDWERYVSALGDAFRSEIEETGQRNEVLLMWDYFSAKLFVRKSKSPVGSALALVRKEIEGKLQNGVDPLEYLSAANERAHAKMRALSREHGFEALVPENPVPLKIFWSASPKHSCAASSKLVNEISWTFHSGSLAFWGALVAEPVLRHEYLSHLVPVNPALSFWVREGWLMEVLMEELKHEDSPERRFDVRALTSFRTRLGRSLGNEGEMAVSAPGMRELAGEMRLQDPELFWQLTKAILEMAPSADAKKVDTALDFAIKASSPIPSMRALHAWLSGR